MEPEKHYLSVGIFVLLTILGIIGFAVWLTGIADQNHYQLYRIHFAESVSGLSVGGPVKFHGVEVGKVSRIAIDPKNSDLVRVDVRIAPGTPIKTDTVASLKLQGITGTSYVELTGGNHDLPNLAWGQAGIPEIPSKPSDISAIVNHMPELIEKASTVASQLNKLMSDQNIAVFGQLLDHTQHIAAALDQQTRQFAALIQQATAVASDVHQITHDAKGDIHEMADSLKESTRQLDALIARTNEAAGGSYEQFYSLMVELKRTTRDMDSLARKLEENPSRLVAPPQQKGVPSP